MNIYNNYIPVHKFFTKIPLLCVSVSLCFSLHLSLLFITGCKDIKMKPKTTTTQNSKKQQQPQLSPLPNLHRLSPINQQISEQIIPDLLNRGMVAEIRRRGILRARLSCDRKPLCFHDSYGIPIGFEVELLSKFAQILNVKLNIVEQENEPCDLQAPVIDNNPTTSNKQLSDPYFYTAAKGWHHILIPSGDTALKSAINRLVRHFYETGTHQQIYKNWFEKNIKKRF